MLLQTLTTSHARILSGLLPMQAATPVRCSTVESEVTAKCWMLYVRIIDLIHQLHFAININYCYLRLKTWEELMMLSFTMSKQDYAQYGTYYLTQMESLDSTHPGTHEEIQEGTKKVCDSQLMEPGNKHLWRAQRLQEIICHFLSVLGRLFLRRQTFFCLQFLDHTKLS